MKLQIRLGPGFNGPVVTTEDGTMLPGQRVVEVQHSYKDGCRLCRVRVEFAVDGDKVAVALNKQALPEGE